jgi:hypothetical protein
MALLVRPAATSRRTCNSRGVSPRFTGRRPPNQRSHARQVRRCTQLLEDHASRVELHPRGVLVPELPPRRPRRRSVSQAARVSPRRREPPRWRWPPPRGDDRRQRLARLQLASLVASVEPLDERPDSSVAAARRWGEVHDQQRVLRVDPIRGRAGGARRPVRRCCRCCRRRGSLGNGPKRATAVIALPIRSGSHLPLLTMRTGFVYLVPDPNASAPTIRAWTPGGLGLRRSD